MVNVHHWVLPYSNDMLTEFCEIKESIYLFFIDLTFRFKNIFRWEGNKFPHISIWLSVIEA